MPSPLHIQPPTIVIYNPPGLMLIPYFILYKPPLDIHVFPSLYNVRSPHHRYIQPPQRSIRHPYLSQPWIYLLRFTKFPLNIHSGLSHSWRPRVPLIHSLRFQTLLLLSFSLSFFASSPLTSFPLLQPLPYSWKLIVLFPLQQPRHLLLHHLPHAYIGTQFSQT